MLRNQIILALQQIAGEQFNVTWFQQDGAPPHWGLNVQGYLDHTFQNRWIGQGGPTEWPPRSPDLTPLDLFLWGYLKSKVYATPIENLGELQKRIIQQCALMSEEMIQRAFDNVFFRIAYCQEMGGSHFENLL